MSLVIRVLPPEEWDRLTEGPLAGGLPPSPHVRIIVVERDGGIIGYWALADVVHAEPVWFQEGEATPAAVMGLLRAVLTELQEAGVAYVYTTIEETQQETIGDLAERVGFIPLPGRLYGAKVPEKS